MQHHDAGDYAAALTAFDRVLELDPELPQGLHGKAIMLTLVDRPAEAIAVLTQAMELSPNDASLWGNYGNALMALGQREAALTAYHHSLTLNPNLIASWRYIGHALRELGKTEEAIAAYERAIALNPADAPSWYWQAQLLRKQGHHTRALEAYEQAVTADPHYKEAWNGRGTLLEVLDRHEDALESYNRALSIDPHYAEAWNNRGIALENRGCHDEALVAFEESLKFDENNPDAWNNCGLALDSAQRPQEAIAAYDRALQLTQGQYWRAWANRGWALFHAQGYYAALQNWRTGLERIDDTLPDAVLGKGILHYHLGRGHAQEGDRLAPSPDATHFWQQACTSFEAALQFLSTDTYPDWHLDVIQELVFAHRQIKQEEAAKRWLKAGTDLLRRRVRETESTSEKVELAAKLASFYQLGSD